MEETSLSAALVEQREALLMHRFLFHCPVQDPLFHRKARPPSRHGIRDILRSGYASGIPLLDSYNRCLHDSSKHSSSLYEFFEHFLLRIYYSL